MIDSGSTDGTAELARRYGASVHWISRDEFEHGATRNLGIALSGGEYVAFIVQDAVPFDEWWLAAMVENLERDKLVAGVYGRQIPRSTPPFMSRMLTVSSEPTCLAASFGDPTSNTHPYPSFC